MPRPKCPLLAVDAVIFDSNQRVLGIQRKNEPFKSSWALPGGFVDEDESVEQALIRELEEETALRLVTWELTMVGVYSDPQRDPRGHVVSIAYTGVVQNTGHVTAGDDAAAVDWIQKWRHTSWAFDHMTIINAAHQVLGLRPSPEGSHSRPNTETLNPPPVRLTPYQRKALQEVYSGRCIEWQECFPGLIKRAFLTVNVTRQNKVVYALTRLGIEAIS